MSKFPGRGGPADIPPAPSDRSPAEIIKRLVRIEAKLDRLLGVGAVAPAGETLEEREARHRALADKLKQEGEA